MPSGIETCKDVWLEYLSALPEGHRHRSVEPDAFAFGGSGALADELARLVVSGTKQATTSLPVEFTAPGDQLPKAGDVSIILDGAGHPVAIIERLTVRTVPFDSVDAAYAAVEGEGDGSLSYWRKAHVNYFESVCRRLGGTFNAQTPVICQEFKLVWPAHREK